MEYRIRKATRNDIDKLAEIYYKSWNFAYKNIISDEFLSSLTYEVRLQRFRDMKEIHEYVYETSDGMIGCSRLIDSRDNDIENCAEIQTIYFLPEFTGMGHGKIFLSWLIENARTKKYKHIIVWCLSANERAGRAYGAAGFMIDNNRLINIGGVGYPETRYRIDL